MDKAFDKLIELVFGGLFFEYPILIPIAIAALTVIFGDYRRRYLWNHEGERGSGLWRSVIVASAGVAAGLSLIGWVVYRY